jgi:dTDP-4-dehydrorhamnose 3,5-epimerase
MAIRILERHLQDVVVLETEVFEDSRGFFMEVFRADQFEALGLPSAFVQDNHSRSSQGVVRGLHFQWKPPMGKLMRVTVGEAFVVAVDIRKGSPTLGQWFGTVITAGNRKQVWAPAGFARGFCVLSDFAEIQYKCTSTYNPECESAVCWDDPALGIQWPVRNPRLSEKDRTAPALKEWVKSPNSDFLRYLPNEG